MLWKHKANLVTVEKTADPEGYKATRETRREVYVNKKSATRSEFYKARATGDEIVLVLEVRGVDYREERRVEFEGKPFDVVRAYSPSGEIVELNCKEAKEEAKEPGEEAEA